MQVKGLSSQSCCHSLRSADDRLPLDSLGPVEGGNRIVEGNHLADVCPQPTVPDPLDELTHLGPIGYDDKVNSEAARGPRLGRAGNGHQRSSCANHTRRPLRNVAADDIENQIDFADVFQRVVIEIDELLCAEVESRLTAGSAPGADDVRASLACELRRHRTDNAGRTVHENTLPRAKAAVLEQALPRGQARHHEGRTNGEIDVARKRREVACLDGYILRQRAVAIPIRQAEDPLPNRQPRRAIAENGDHSGQFVWRERTPYWKDSDFVFPSFRLKGSKPLSASIMVQKYLRPAAVKAGVLKDGKGVRFGFHNFRHSLASALVKLKCDPKTVQGILRHEDVRTTMQLYVQSDQESKLEAQGKFSELLLGDKAHLLTETIQ